MNACPLQAELDAVLADLDSQWEADSDGKGVTRHCISRTSKNDEPMGLRQVNLPGLWRVSNLRRFQTWLCTSSCTCCRLPCTHCARLE